MSTLVRDEATSTLTLLCKGSVEAMAPVCLPDSLPRDLQEAAKDYARNGCYVIALASRPCPEVDPKQLAQLERKKLEGGLVFRGLLLLRNEVQLAPPPFTLLSLPLSSNQMPGLPSSPSNGAAFIP